MQREHTPEKIRAALACIPADDRELWVRMGMALKNEYGDDGWPLFNEWSASAANYDAAAAAATWKSCKASGGVGLGTLWREAMGRGFDPKRFGPVPAVSKEETARRDAERKQRELSDKAKQEDGQREAAAKAAELWGAAAESGNSPYLKRKGVEAHGVRFGKGCILVPVRDAAGQLWNLQRIYGRPLAGGNDKIFLKGGRVSGCYHAIGTPDATGWLLVAEGYATAATLHQVCGLPVVVAFNASNLRHVAETMRRLFPDVQLLICADDDRTTEAETGKNPGLLAAKDAARRARGQMVAPAGLPEDGSDFNDLARASGTEQVRQQLEAAMRPQLSVQTVAGGTDKDAANQQAAATRDVKVQGGGEVAATKAKAPKAPKSARPAGRPWFDVDGKGVWYHGFSDQGDPLPPYWVCSRLDVEAKTRDEHNGEWGFLLVANDADGHPKQWAMPARMLAGDGTEYRATLLSMGVNIAPGSKAKNLLTTYIQTAATETRARCTDRIGWHGSAFVLPDRTIGEAEGERVLFQSAAGVVSQFKQRGTLDDWKTQVAAACVGNTRLTFCASAGFAAPLLHHAGLQSGGFHLVGDSSSGKTTGLRVAASVFGGRDYARSWRATDNALELTAAQHSDALLILDEIGQVDPKIIGDTVYMLANEAGKGRATRTATARPALTWRLLFLSDGEIKLSDHMAEAGKVAKSGQEIRLANIPADAGKGLGVFEDLCGFVSGKALSDHLQEATRSYYGTAGMGFIEWAVAHQAELAEALREGVSALVSDWVVGSAHGQVFRVASRFALVGVAGELSTSAGLTGWPAGWATSAARACFDAWLTERGGAGSGEHKSMVRQVRSFLELHGDARFTWVNRAADDHKPNTMNRAGYKRLVTGSGTPINTNTDYLREFGDKMSEEAAEASACEYFIQPEVWRREVCKGYEPKAVAALLMAMDVLQHEEKSGRPDKLMRIPGVGRTRVYCISAGLFELDV
ncbi:DUF927 domain-containing protein [Cupriavidus basilensis]|uniref:DUF927 domain-containing protein n=1 Tax=Cupriavidus basilensis TaxID=68895 RepID=UPI0020A659F1|nr:DUF927 domain-containing protein [Cupriavidus basilensis]MCP3019627.1 DUF927 domain-containing protein [Cupriavidus basilensis]